AVQRREGGVRRAAARVSAGQVVFDEYREAAQGLGFLVSVGRLVPGGEAGGARPQANPGVPVRRRGAREATGRPGGVRTLVGGRPLVVREQRIGSRHDRGVGGGPRRGGQAREGDREGENELHLKVSILRDGASTIARSGPSCHAVGANDRVAGRMESSAPLHKRDISHASNPCRAPVGSSPPPSGG